MLFVFLVLFSLFGHILVQLPVISFRVDFPKLSEL